MGMGGTQDSPFNPDKDTQYGGCTGPDLQTYYKITIIKTMRKWHKDAWVTQGNTAKSRNKASH